MIDYEKFASFLNANIETYKCYLDSVPEKAVLPAVSYTHVGHRHKMLLSGTISGKSNTWRLSACAEKEEEITGVAKSVELLHNVETEFYKNVFVKLVIGQHRDKNQPNRQILYDVTTYEG